jgi:hypothetical protein
MTDHSSQSTPIEQLTVANIAVSLWLLEIWGLFRIMHQHFHLQKRPCVTMKTKRGGKEARRAMSKRTNHSMSGVCSLNEAFGSTVERGVALTL